MLFCPLTHTNTHTQSGVCVGVVQGPEKGEGKHLVTLLFLTKLLEVRRQQGWTSREHRRTAASVWAKQCC